VKVIFHEDFRRSDYASNGASVPGRMEAIMDALRPSGFMAVSPEPVSYGEPEDNDAGPINI